MNRLHIVIFMAAALAAIACTSRDGAYDNGNGLIMVAGTYTDSLSRDIRRGIYTFRFDQHSGKSMPLDTFAMDNPSFLTLSEDGNTVYAVSEMPEENVAIYALKLDRSNGRLQLLNAQRTGSANPCHVSVKRKMALVSNYTGGTLSLFPLNDDGSPAPVTANYKGGTGGPDTIRQPVPHIHCSQPSPDGKYVFASDFSADRLLRLPITPDGKGLMPADTAFAVEPDSGPRHFVFSPDGKHLYLLGELSGKVTVFRYGNGILSHQQTVLADSAKGRGSADIHLSPDGRFLYTSNRIKEEGIAIFSVDENGKLTRIGYRHTAAHPRNFCITPNGKYLLVACRYGNVIQIFKRDEKCGLPEECIGEIKLERPVCIRFVHQTTSSRV